MTKTGLEERSAPHKDNNKIIVQSIAKCGS